jgi:hypothetical protein
VARTKKGRRVITVDMSKATGGGRLRVPEGDYAAKVLNAKYGTSEASGNPMVTVQFVGTKGKIKNKEFRDYFVLTDKSLWKLRGFMEALGMDVPKRKLKIDLDRFTGKKVGVTIGDDEDQNSKPVSRPQDYIDVDSVGKVAMPEDEDKYEGLSRAKLEKTAKKNKVKFKASDTDDKLRKRLRKADENVDDIDLEEEM